MMTKIQQHLFMMRKFRMPLFLLASGLLVTGCSSFDEAVGKAKRSPDEFQVVVRPPLTLPPSFSLEPVDSSAKQESASDAISGTAQVPENTPHRGSPVDRHGEETGHGASCGWSQFP